MAWRDGMTWNEDIQVCSVQSNAIFFFFFNSCIHARVVEKHIVFSFVLYSFNAFQLVSLVHYFFFLLPRSTKCTYPIHLTCIHFSYVWHQISHGLFFFKRYLYLAPLISILLPFVLSIFMKKIFASEDTLHFIDCMTRLKLLFFMRCVRQSTSLSLSLRTPLSIFELCRCAISRTSVIFSHSCNNNAWCIPSLDCRWQDCSNRVNICLW